MLEWNNPRLHQCCVCYVITIYLMFRLLGRCRLWYVPPCPLSHPNWWNYHFYINLIHFSVHLAGPHRRGALTSLSFLPFLILCLFPPEFPINPFSHHLPTQTTIKYPSLPTISLNASIHQLSPPSHQISPVPTNISPCSPNPSPTIHNAPKSSPIS